MDRQLYALNRIQNFYGFSVLQMELPRNMFKDREEETSLTEFIKGDKGTLVQRAPWEAKDKLDALKKIHDKEELFDWSGTAQSKANTLAIPLLSKYAWAEIPPSMAGEDYESFLDEGKEGGHVDVLLTAFHINPQTVSDEDTILLEEILKDIYTRRDIAFFVE